jgi:hypothetical protein
MEFPPADLAYERGMFLLPGYLQVEYCQQSKVVFVAAKQGVLELRVKERVNASVHQWAEMRSESHPMYLSTLG